MTPEISIVTPAFNESGNVRRLYDAVRGAVGDESAEIVFVDDGSTDDTAQRVRELRATDRGVRLVRLRRNFGNQAALLAGLHAACGRAVITMDCDLQHPPAELPRMIAEWRNGARVVQMLRLRNPDAGLMRRLTTRLFDGLLRTLTDLRIVEGAGDFRLMDARVVRELLQFSDARPFYRGMIAWMGYPVSYLDYQASGRGEGRSGIGFRKRLNLSLDGITALSIRPLRLALLLGLTAILLAFAYAVVVLIAYLYGHSVSGYPTIIFTVVFLGAVQLICTGVMGEYLGRVYEQSRGLPPYIVAGEDDD